MRKRDISGEFRVDKVNPPKIIGKARDRNIRSPITTAWVTNTTGTVLRVHQVPAHLHDQPPAKIKCRSWGDQVIYVAP